MFEYWAALHVFEYWSALQVFVSRLTIDDAVVCALCLAAYVAGNILLLAAISWFTPEHRLQHRQDEQPEPDVQA
jgi:hypothetical protein